MTKKTMTTEKKKFDAEVGKVLHLMIHSLYTNKEIFMRELISNASDACDKLRYISQTTPGVLGNDAQFKITIKVDKEKKVISIRDNGIGMSKSDLIENLGTIAKSGTQNFLQSLSGDSKKDSLLIGQFGVGFYSAFMVADYIEVISKKAGEDEVNHWSSDGAGEYVVSTLAEDFARGTEIRVHIKNNDDSFLDHFRLKHIIKTYSDHIAIPVYFVDESGNETQINSSSALWTRSKAEITPEQYKDLYKSLSYSVDDPWITLHNKNEGAVEFTNLLFIPSTKTFDLFHPDRKRRVKLYIKRVFISDENIDLIPHYLRFLRGIVDSEDLPLNISRETLQNNSTLEKIKNAITKRVINELKKKKDDANEEYQVFWNNFGNALKEGLCEAGSDGEKILELCIFKSALKDTMISLDEYIANCKDEQKTIYYLSGDDPIKLRASPQIEGFLTQGIDVLLFTDPVDDFWVSVNYQYKGYEIKSATRSNIDLEDIKSGDKKDLDENNLEQKDITYAGLLTYFKEILGSAVKDVQISKKLTSSPACLVVGDGEMDMRMERFLREQKQLAKSAAKILEINPSHKIIQKIDREIKSSDLDPIIQEELSKLVKMIFDQACIVEGEQVSDPAGFAKRFDDLIQKVFCAN